MNGEFGPVHWRDPFNGDTERLARDAAAWMRMMCPKPCGQGAARLSVARQEDA